MPGLIIGGHEIPVPGLTIDNYRDHPKLALRVGYPDSNDGGRRKPGHWVRLVVLHTTKGIPGGRDRRPQDIRPGFGRNTDAGERTARFWSGSGRSSGAHLVVDHDGHVSCLADLELVGAYHAGDHLVNKDSVGIEIFQGGHAELYQGQLHAVADLVDAITAHFGIQRQIPDRYRGALEARFNDKNVVGVVGHRDVSDNRGAGDPGDAVFDVLAQRGYERFDFKTSADRAEWRARQMRLADRGLLGPLPVAVDGVPGPRTVAALKRAGFAFGIWSAVGAARLDASSTAAP